MVRAGYIVSRRLLAAMIPLAAFAAAACAPTDSPRELDEPHLNPPVTVTAQNSPAVELCKQIAPGTIELSQNALLSFSRTHANVRLFSSNSPKAADEALIATWTWTASPDFSALKNYAMSLTDTCALGGEWRNLGPASVTLRGDVAWVKPGIGTPEIPQGALAAVLDLSDLPNTPDFEEALLRAVPPLIDTTLVRPSRRSRTWTGLGDETNTGRSIYSDALTLETPAAIEPQAVSALPLAVYVRGATPAVAVEIAALLRIKRRAWLVGDSIDLRAAESIWQPVGANGLSVRAFDLILNGTRLPDVIQADFSDENDLLAAQMKAHATPESLSTVAQNRAPISLRGDYGKYKNVYIEPRAIRAMLLTAHGMTRLFSPTKEATALDDLLLLLWSSADTVRTRVGAMRLLERLAEPLRDGQSTVIDLEIAPDVTTSALPIAWELSANSVLIGRTLVRDTSPGDEIQMIDRLPVSQWLSDRMAMSSASTSAHRILRTLGRLASVDDPVELQLATPTGQIKSIVVIPQPQALYQSLASSHSERPSGWLTQTNSLPAPRNAQIYYLNLARDRMPSPSELVSVLDTAREEQGALIIDARADLSRLTPNGVSPVELIRMLIGRDAPSLRYEIPTLRYPGNTLPKAIESTTTMGYTLTPSSAATFIGPVVLLVSADTAGPAEDFAATLAAARDVTVIGQPTAGALGNLTTVKLPGGLGLRFSNMLAAQTDISKGTRSPVTGKGLMPNRIVVVDARALSEGRDPAIEMGISTLLTQTAN